MEKIVTSCNLVIYGGRRFEQPFNTTPDQLLVKSKFMNEDMNEKTIWEELDLAVIRKCESRHGKTTGSLAPRYKSAGLNFETTTL